MKKVFLIHGFEGEPNGGWRPWLMRELAKEGVWACALPMPDPYHPDRDAWIQTIKNSIDVSLEDVILVGHSLGGPAITYFLETLKDDEKVGGVVFAASPSDLVRDNIIHELENFYSKTQDLELAKTHILDGAIIHGDNDPVVPIEHAERLREVFGLPLFYIKNGGHLNGSSGFTELPEALDAVLKIIHSEK